MNDPTHVPCCSSHGVPMTCERYRRTHFCEVRPCCVVDADRLRNELPDDVTKGSGVIVVEEARR